MVYGRYNMIFFALVHGVYKPTNITGGAPSCRDGDFDDFELRPSATKAWNRRVTPYVFVFASTELDYVVIQKKSGSVIPPFLSLFLSLCINITIIINIIITIIYYY